MVFSLKMPYFWRQLSMKKGLKKKNIKDYESSKEYKDLLKSLPDIELIDIEKKDD